MPADDYTEQSESAIDKHPVLFRTKTFDRHARAIDYVNRYNRARYPRDGRGRTTKPAKGAWGYLASGHSISAASGLTLGSGTVTLCSRSGSSLTADGEEVTVYNSGQVINGPKTLELDWTDGDWAVCECGAPPPNCGSCCVTCSPCPIPKADLTLVINGATTTTLVYNSLVPNWSDGTHTLACSGGNAVLTGGGTWTNTAHTCNALSLTYTSGGNTAVITGPTYGATTCCTAIHVTGCCGIDLPGATVKVYSGIGGALLAEGVTPASGTVNFVWSGSCTVYVTVTEGSGRFQNYAQTLTLTNGGTKTIGLTVTSGYHCFSTACVYPIKDILTFTGAGGSCTLTYGLRAAHRWTGCYTPNTANVYTNITAICTATVTTAQTPVEITLDSGLGCASLPDVAANWLWFTIILSHPLAKPDVDCSGGLLTLFYGGSCPVFNASAGDNFPTMVCPLSFSLTGTLPAISGGGIVNPAGGSYTITE